MGTWLCIDVGFTFTRFGVWRSEQFSSLQKLRTPDTRSQFGTQSAARRKAWLDWLKHHVDQIVGGSGDFQKIALCFPGVVSSEGVIWRSNSIWGNADVDMYPEELSAILGLPVTVLNDLSASTVRYGEDSTLTDEHSVVVVSVSSGIGAKLYDRVSRRLMLEQRGRNGELGLAVVEYGHDALTNDNGNLRGILGNYASGVGFSRLLERAISKSDATAYENSMLARALGQSPMDKGALDRVTLNELAVNCILAGDTFTRDVLAESVRYLAQVLHIVMLFNAPARIVLTGGFASSLGELYRSEVVSALILDLRLLYDEQEIDRVIRLGYGDDMDNLVGLVAWLKRLELDE